MKFNHRKVFIFKQFISDNECDNLSNWILSNFESPMFKQSKHAQTKRVTTRPSPWDNVIYPTAAYQIQKKIDFKIKDIFKIYDLKRVPVFPDGMYASYGFRGDICQLHTDHSWIEGHITYHFNIMLSDNEGGDLIIENNKFSLNKKDGILYPVSELSHSTTELLSEPRLFWSFGYCIPLLSNIDIVQ